MSKSFRSLFLLLVLVGSLFIYPVQPAYAIAIPAEINKQFTPILIDSGGISVLRVTVFNPNTFQLTSTSWADNLVGVQPGLRIAPPGLINNTCGGNVTAVPNTTALSLTGGIVPPQLPSSSTPGECYVEINVTSTTPGNLINTIPAQNLNATGDDAGTTVTISNTTPASATLTVVAIVPPTLSKGFNPNTIFVGGVSQLTITINNNDTDTNLTQTSFTDTLPAGVLLANPVNGSLTNCGGSASLAAASGGNTITLNNGTVTPSQNCIVRVDVTSNTAGQFTNTIPAGPGVPGSIVTQQGVTNGSPASAQLNVQPVGITKAFSPANIPAGGTSILTITLQNPTGSAYTGADLTDNLPAGLTVSGTPTTTCGGTISNTANSVTLDNGIIPASATPPTPVGTCTITVTVTAPATAGNSTQTNTIPPNSLITTQGVTNPSPATANLVVQAGINVLKAYSPTTIAAGGTSTVTVTLQNRTGSPFTGVNLTDTLPPNLTVVGAPASPQCGGTITNTATSVTLAGGTIPASATPPTPPGACTITLQVTSSVAGSGTTYENTIPAGSVTTNQGVGNLTNTATGTDLTVVAAGGPVGLSKAFQTNPIQPGQVTRLRITLTAPVDTALTGINIVDTLPVGLVVAATPAPTDNCPGANVVAPVGGNTITLTGGTLAAGASCNIDVRVTTTAPNTYINSIPPNTITTNELRTNTNTANATLRVTSLSTSKEFFPPSVAANGLSTLTITLTNTTDSPLINVSVTDALSTMGGTVPTSGVYIAADPNESTTCGSGVITFPDTRTIQMVGGTVPAAQPGGIPGICTINVDVQGRGGSTTRTNTLPIANVNGTVQTTSTLVTPMANATAQLTIADLGIGVVKGFNPVLVYGGAYSTMSVQLVNPNNATLTGIAFTDDMALLGVGMELADPVTFNVGTCGGVLTGNPGDSSFSFSGGTLFANSNCILTLRVVMAVNGNLTNRIPAGAVTTFNGVRSTQPTEASLTNLPGASVSKSFNPNAILAGGFSTLTITIQNTSTIPLVGMALTDNLPGSLPTGLEIAGVPAPAPTTDCGDPLALTLSAPAGSQTISLANGSLAGNSSCTINISVTSNIPGTYVNTIPVGGLTATAGGSPVSNNNPASAPLTVNGTGGYSLGNRVWFDTDNNGSINGTEVGINSVDVQLYSVDALGNTTFVGTQTTANGGYYRFDNLPAGDYIAVIPASEFGPGGTLDGYWSSGTTINGGGGVGEATAPDPDNDVDSDDNGTLQTGATFTGAVVSSAVTLGPSTTEPTNDADADPTNPAGEASNDNSNRTVDFGFYRVELGNLVFSDANNNGTYDAGDTPLVGATVQLYSSNGTEIHVGPDGIFGTPDDAGGNVVTGAGGIYLFSGLPAGNYIVGVTPPNNATSTLDTAAPADTTNPNSNIDNNDNGIGIAGGQVFSNTVSLTPGSAGAASNNVVNTATGTTTNPTVDFGFNAELFSLGNRVWFDTDNNGVINGLEEGIDSVDVELYSIDGLGNTTLVAMQTTANNGYYRFDNLPAGDYVVVIPASEFGAGGALGGYWSSGTTISSGGAVGETTAPDADNDVDSDDNGTLQTGATFTGAVVSSTVTLGPSPNEPTNDTDADPTNPAGEAPNDHSNRTVDFGFYRVELGDLVFLDGNNNGMFDTGETPLAGAIVQLYSSNGTEIFVGPDGIFGTADDTSGNNLITGAGGTYLFSGLPAGDYIVKVTPPLGYTSTVDVNPDTTSPNNNVNDNDNGVGVAGGQVSSNIVSLVPGVTGASTTVTNGTGTTSNPSIDFGFVLANGFLKSITGTSAPSTNGLSITIGEIITYQVTVSIPPGTYTNAVLVDTMQQGLAFVACDTITAPGLTTSVGNGFVSVCSNPTTDDAGGGTPADVDRRVTFDFGTLTNSGQTNAILTVTYRAIVLDIGPNIDGVSLNNSAALSSSAGTMGPAQTTVGIIEPELLIAKTSNVNFIASGSAATITLVISHSPASNTDSFDVIASDELPLGLDYVQNSLDCTNGEQDPDVSCSYDTATRTITAEWSVFTRLPASDRGIIQFDVVGNALIPTNGSVTNVANVEWSSLPGDQTAPQSFSNPPNPFATERFYDPADPVDFYNTSASLTLTPLGSAAGGAAAGGGSGSPDSRATRSPFLIPVTGFAPGVVTELNTDSRPVYSPTTLTLEIPVLKVSTSIVGVQLKNGSWDVSWLQNQAGWLNGTAYPTLTGNSVLMAHAVNAVGKPAVFSKLKSLNPGEFIFVYDKGYRYTYKVVSNEFAQPNDISVLQHEDKAYLTLITCDAYDERTATYLKRIVVRAVLVDIREVK